MDINRISDLKPAPVAPKEQTVMQRRRGVMIIISKIILLLVIAAIIILTPTWLKKMGWIGSEDVAAIVDPNAYSAIFLTNGQVYFGHLISSNENEMVLKGVYYLQAAPNTPNINTPDQNRFTLIKLGQEVHGPTDELYINRQQVLFYEKLRDDSKVVQSIEQAQ